MIIFLRNTRAFLMRSCFVWLSFCYSGSEEEEEEEEEEEKEKEEAGGYVCAVF